MSATNFSLTNQALAFANSLYKLAQQKLPALTSAAKLEQSALLGGCAWQLSRAWHFYLREIADKNHLKNSGSIMSLEQLKSALTAQDRHAPELVEFEELLAQPNSWLTQLHRHAHESMQSPPKHKEKKAFKSETFIEVVDLTDTGEAPQLTLDVTILGEWQEAFRSLIIRQRDNSAEF